MKKKKKKKMLNELTFCIPVRIDSEYRLRNLNAILRFYDSQIDARYIILEADSEQHLFDLPNISTLKYVFVHDSNPVFHRTHYLNYMLSIIETKVAAIWDTDAVAPIIQVIKAYESVVNNKCVICYPYDGCFWGVTEYFSSAFCQNMNINILRIKQPLHLMCGYYSVGGAFLVNVDLYKEYGWENEYFIGWGPEDAERYRRVYILGGIIQRITGNLYHLYHTRGINSGNFDKQLAKITKREYIRICSMYPEQLRKEISYWTWIKR